MVSEEEWGVSWMVIHRICDLTYSFRRQPVGEEQRAPHSYAAITCGGTYGASGVHSSSSNTDSAATGMPSSSATSYSEKTRDLGLSP